MKKRWMRLLLAGLIGVCLAAQAWCGAGRGGAFVGDLVFDREIPVSLVAGTAQHPRLATIEWIRVEARYGNSWGATASLMFWNGNMGRALQETVKTDPNGSFVIPAVPVGHRYSVTATAEGYGETYTMNLDVPEGHVAQPPSAGEPEDTAGSSGGDEARHVQRRTSDETSRITDPRSTVLPPLVLHVANLDLAGRVIDGEGNPVAKARVYCYRRGQSHQQTETDALGRFTFHKVCAGVIQIQANTMGTTNLHGMLQTEGGTTDVTVVLGARPSFAPAKLPSLVGKPLPSLAPLDPALPAETYRDQMILLCFFDMSQRPSRRALTTLGQQAEGLRQKDVAVLAVHVGQAEAPVVTQWAREQGLTLPVSTIKGDARNAGFPWASQSLPWLILTDRRHVVRAQGFTVDELNGKIEEASARR